MNVTFNRSINSFYRFCLIRIQEIGGSDKSVAFQQEGQFLGRILARRSGKTESYGMIQSMDYGNCELWDRVKNKLVSHLLQLTEPVVLFLKNRGMQSGKREF